MASIIARAPVVVKLSAEDSRDRFVFNEVRVLAVGVVGGQRRSRYVLSDPGRIASAAVEDGGYGEGGVEIVDWTGKAVLKEAVGVDGGGYVLEWARIRGHWRCG